MAAALIVVVGGGFAAYQIFGTKASLTAEQFAGLKDSGGTVGGMSVPLFGPVVYTRDSPDSDEGLQENDSQACRDEATLLADHNTAEIQGNAGSDGLSFKLFDTTSNAASWKDLELSCWRPPWSVDHGTTAGADWSAYNSISLIAVYRNVAMEVSSNYSLPEKRDLILRDFVTKVDEAAQQGHRS